MMNNHRWPKVTLRLFVAMVATFSAAVSVAGGDAVDHSEFSGLLARHVVDGAVDYAALAEERERLLSYLARLGSVDENALRQQDRSEQLAFWINAYNAQVLDIVLEHRPLKRRGLRGLVYPSNSVQQIPGVWKRQTRKIAGEPRSLDGIEHGIIRAEFEEPRIHFALVCAAVSCPPLRSEAYLPGKIDQQLQEQTRKFLMDSDRGAQFDAQRNRVLVSSIFDWFAEDFGGAAGVAQFVSRHGPETIRAALTGGEAALGHLRYDWTLNDQANESPAKN